MGTAASILALWSLFGRSAVHVAVPLLPPQLAWLGAFLKLLLGGSETKKRVVRATSRAA